MEIIIQFDGDDNPRSDFSHGSHFHDGGNEFMDDHVNGVDWHVPDRREREHPEPEDREFDKWLNGR